MREQITELVMLINTLLEQQMNSKSPAEYSPIILQTKKKILSLYRKKQKVVLEHASTVL